MKTCILIIVILAVGMIPSCVNAASNVLNWVDNSDNEANFHIERKAEACIGSGVFNEIATTGINIATFTDATVVEGVTYCYRVAASNSSGKSAFSNTAERLVPFSVPVPPSVLTVTGGL